VTAPKKNDRVTHFEYGVGTLVKLAFSEAQVVFDSYGDRPIWVKRSSVQKVEDACATD
jgi:hypothetical protein